MSELELQKLQKKYGETIAVRKVDLVLNEPKYCCLLGPSGCGKTSLLRMIAGHEVISSGSVIIDGRDISEKPPSLRPTSMMFQNYALFPHLKVIDNVAFALKISGIDKLTRHERAMEMLRGVQLEKLADRFPNQLSGGQQQRVAVARALVSQPAIVFADEPTGNLDSITGNEVLEFLRSAVDDLNQTLVMVTHDAAAASRADRVLFLADGKIVEELSAPSSEEIFDTLKRLDG